MLKGRLASREETSSESGVALIAVLWTTILLSVLAAALITMSRSDARLLIAEQARLQAGEAAESAINLALLALSDPHGGIPMDGTPQNLRFGDVEVAVSISPEAGKIDLNTGDRDLIRGLLLVAGASPGRADKMADAIVDRRTPGAASDSDLVNTGMVIKQSAFLQSIGELFQIPGMNRDLFNRLASNLTLYSGSPSVDVTLASADVLLAIPGNTRADAEAALLARSSRMQEPNAAPDMSRVIGQAFTATATAQSSDGIIVHRTEIVRLVTNLNRPVWLLSVQ